MVPPPENILALLVLHRSYPYDIDAKIWFSYLLLYYMTIYLLIDYYNSLCNLAEEKNDVQLLFPLFVSVVVPFVLIYVVHINFF